MGASRNLSQSNIYPTADGRTAEGGTCTEPMSCDAVRKEAELQLGDPESQWIYDSSTFCG